MSATLYALVMLHGTTLSFSPGYASPTECYSVYKGPFVSCFTTTPTALAGRRSLNYLTVVLERSAESIAKTSVNATLVPLETAFLQRVGSYPRSFAAL
jgi:hypothetical protein